MSQSNTRTDQARARWAAEYREARKVRKFERALLAGNLSSIGYAAPRAAYQAVIERVLWPNLHNMARTLGRFGAGTGKRKRHIIGPRQSLPA